MNFMRKLLPEFWVIGLRSCDDPHYGRPYYWFKSFTLDILENLSYRHLEMACDRASDGPAIIEKISFFQYLKAPQKKRVYRG